MGFVAADRRPWGHHMAIRARSDGVTQAPTHTWHRRRPKRTAGVHPILKREYLDIEATFLLSSRLAHNRKGFLMAAITGPMRLQTDTSLGGHTEVKNRAYRTNVKSTMNPAPQRSLTSSMHPFVQTSSATSMHPLGYRTNLQTTMHPAPQRGLTSSMRPFVQTSSATSMHPPGS